MQLARVLSPITSSQKDDSFQGRKLLLVQLTDLEGHPKGASFVALEADGIGAGPGDWVLLQREGTGCRQMMNDPQGPVNTMICGIIDSIHSHQSTRA